MNKRISFYKTTVSKWIKDKDAKILIVAGGRNDSDVFKDLNYGNVTISNVDARIKGNEFHPFMWSFQDAENLLFEDNSFDFVVVHAALHHCYSPHRALLNMYRVAKQGVILFESRDSFIINIMIHLNLTQTYEHAAVFYNDCKYGGVENTDIPNFIYRWTEQEIEKTINCYAPFAHHNFLYKYGYDVPCTPQLEKRSYKVTFVYFSRIFYSLFIKLFPKQQNLFACFIEKPNLEKELFKWLKYEEGKIVFNKEWAENHYKKA